MGKLKTLLKPICLLGPYFQYKEEVKTLLNKFNDYTLLSKCNSLISHNLSTGNPKKNHNEFHKILWFN